MGHFVCYGRLDMYNEQFLFSEKTFMNFISFSKLGPWPFYVILLFLFCQKLFIQSVDGGENEVDEVFSNIENLTRKMAKLVPHSHPMGMYENEEEAMLKFMGTNLSKIRQFLEPLGTFLTAASNYYKIDYLAEKCNGIDEKLQVMILIIDIRRALGAWNVLFRRITIGQKPRFGKYSKKHLYDPNLLQLIK
jgi:hypothetical protein